MTHTSGIEMRSRAAVLNFDRHLSIPNQGRDRFSGVLFDEILKSTNEIHTPICAQWLNFGMGIQGVPNIGKANVDNSSKR